QDTGEGRQPVRDVARRRVLGDARPLDGNAVHDCPVRVTHLVLGVSSDPRHLDVRRELVGGRAGVPVPSLDGLAWIERGDPAYLLDAALIDAGQLSVQLLAHRVPPSPAPDRPATGEPCPRPGWNSRVAPPRSNGPGGAKSVVFAPCGRSNPPNRPNG